MFLAQAVGQHFPQAARVLDLCAAPGGKSTLLAQCLPDTSLLVSNEVIRSRAGILAENMAKWGNANTLVTHNTPADFAALPGWFDVLVVDAPCSGEGMFRKDVQAVDEWSPRNVDMCAARQCDILREAWPALKPGGVLVYSTCTYNRQENEDNVAWTCRELGAERLSIDLKGRTDIVETEGGYHFYPHRTRGEGFFLSVMRKWEDAPLPRPSKPARFKGVREQPWRGALPLPLRAGREWAALYDGDRVTAYPADLKEDMRLAERTWHVVQAGVSLGRTKGRDFVPDAAAALSKALDSGAVASVEVDGETAIAYLRRDNLVLPDAPKGHVLVCHRGLPLGWVKNLGNRCNNLYPQEWRIRMRTMNNEQ